MASSNGGGGGFNRFARRKTDAPTKAPAPAARAMTNENAASPNNDFTAFGSSMFGGSFDMSFESTAAVDDKASYDYNDFGGFGSGVPETPEQAGVPLSNDTTAAIAGDGVDPTTQSTIPSQESIATPVTTNKTTGGPFQFRASQGAPNPAASRLTSPPRPKTAAPPAQQGGNNKPGLSMFSSRKRAPAAPSQEPSLLAEKTNESRIMANNGGKSLQQPTAPSTATMTNNSAPTTSTLGTNNENTGSPFQRVLPPPSIPPAPQQTPMMGATIASTTPKGSSNTTASVYMPPHNGDRFVTPLPRAPGPEDSSMMQKTTGNETATVSFVTPESNLGGVTTTTPAPQNAAKSSFLAGKEMGDGFDDQLSLFLADLRSATDRQLHGTSELLDLEVDLSRLFANTLRDYSDSLDMLDNVEDVFGESDNVLAIMQQQF